MNIDFIHRWKWPLVILSGVSLLASPVFADDDDDDEDFGGPVIQVAPPSGDAATDVLNIQGAIDMAAPGTVVQFAPGTYRVTPDAQFVISIDDLTLQGADDSRTTILGVAAFPGGFLFQGDFLLVASRTTIRHLTFDGFDFAVEVYRDGVQPTGHLIERNTFRNGFLPIQTWSFSDDMIRIRKNKIVNVQIGVRVIGKTVHFYKNKITAPEPETMLDGKPYAAGIIFTHYPFGVAENNVFEDNKIVGNADGFFFNGFPGESCINNVVRDNEFVDMRVWFDFDYGSMVWLNGNGGVMEGNIIEGNEVEGSQGVGVLITGGSHNYIVDNEFEDFVAGDVLPWFYDFFDVPLTAIFMADDTTGNYVVENEFENVPNPIEDWGIDNIFEDNEVEDDD